MKIVDIPKDGSIEQAIGIAWQERENFQSVIVLAIQKDGTQWMTTSKMPAIEKSFLLAFFQAVMTKWFQL